MGAACRGSISWLTYNKAFRALFLRGGRLCSRVMVDD